MPRKCRKTQGLPQGRGGRPGSSLRRKAQSQAAFFRPCAPPAPQKIGTDFAGAVHRRRKSLFLQKKSCFFQEKPLQRAFSYYIILLLRSAQYGMRQKVAGGHFRVISADNRPTIGRSKGQMPEKRGAFALKNSYGTHGSVYKGAMMQAPDPAGTQPVVGRRGKAARGATLAKEE